MAKKPKGLHLIEKVPFGTENIRFKGVWDMDDLYQKMADWFKNRKYRFYEVVYKHKSPGPFGKEAQLVWKAERKEEDYHRFIISIYCHIYDASNIEVQNPDGTSKIMTKGRIWIEMTGSLEFDYEKRWESSEFYANLRNFYNKYIIKKRVDHILWDQLWYREINKLHDLIMNTLKMHTAEHEHRIWTGAHE